jgi:hypothetical protein
MVRPYVSGSDILDSVGTPITLIPMLSIDSNISGIPFDVRRIG